MAQPHQNWMTWISRFAGSRVRRNSLWLVGGDTIAKLIGMVTTILYARLLSEQGWGMFKLAQSLAILFSLFPDMGLHRWGIREIARCAQNRWGLLLTLAKTRRRLAGYTVLAGVVASLVIVWYRQSSAFLFLVLSLSVMHIGLRGIKQTWETAFHGHQDMHWPALFNLIFRIVTIVVTPAIAWLTGSVLLLVLGLLVIEALDFLFQRQAAKTLYADPAQPPLAINIVETIRYAVPFSVQIFATLIYFHVDSVMLYLIHGSEELVGYYATGYWLILAALVIPSSFSSAVFPALAQRPASESFRLHLKTVPVYLAFGIGFVALVYPFREIWIDTLFTAEKFGPSIPILGILAWVFPLYCLTMMTGNYLGATQRQHWVMIVSIAMALANIVLNMMWIPEMGALGAALATVATEVIGLVAFVGCFIYTKYVVESG